MKSIGGNVIASVQVKIPTGKDRIGTPTFEWSQIREVKGYLDMLNGDSRYTTYNAKLQESTHVFMCDYFPMENGIHDIRLVINGKTYELKYVDDPMELHQHYELFLAFVG